MRLTLWPKLALRLTKALASKLTQVFAWRNQNANQRLVNAKSQQRTPNDIFKYFLLL